MTWHPLAPWRWTSSCPVSACSPQPSPACTVNGIGTFTWQSGIYLISAYHKNSFKFKIYGCEVVTTYRDSSINNIDYIEWIILGWYCDYQQTTVPWNSVCGVRWSSWSNNPSSRGCANASWKALHLWHSALCWGPAHCRWPRSIPCSVFTKCTWRSQEQNGKSWSCKFCWLKSMVKIWK